MAYQVQLATPAEDHDRYIAADRWIAQPKYDGKRLILDLVGDRVTAQNRLGKSCPFPPALAAGLRGLGSPDLALDGELVGQRFFTFDVLRLNGNDTRGLPQSDRSALLALLFGGATATADGSVVLAETASGADEKRALYERIRSERGEGVVFKDTRSTYVGRRVLTWIKAKFWASATCVVTCRNDTGERLQVSGLEIPHHSHPVLSRSVQVSLIDAGKLVVVGDVTIPVSRPVPSLGTLIEVRYLYAYPAPEIRLYQPVYEGLRDDVTPDAAQLSQLKWKQGLALVEG